MVSRTARIVTAAVLLACTLGAAACTGDDSAPLAPEIGIPLLTETDTTNRNGGSLGSGTRTSDGTTGETTSADTTGRNGGSLGSGT